jgi:dihydrofolate synthase/folylpolyglutamate synthase
MSAVYKRLESLEKIGIKLGLRNIKTILEALGQPQNSYRSILIAGTNGKGSTGAMLDSILTKHGFKTGYYTSPHLIDVRERVQIQRQMISADHFESSLATVFEAVDSMMSLSKLEGPPTYFEVLTALALLHFQKSKVDFAVIEVGLGGRFDATNAVSQNISIITSIDYDHEEFLGKSIAQIASEKAGIFKSNVPVVTGLLPLEAANVVQENAERLGCNLKVFDPGSLLDLHLKDGFPVFRYAPWNKDIRINLRGRHQAQNGGVALLTCNALQDIGVDVKADSVINGLNEVVWPGRLDLLQENPPVLLDCAHNPMGVKSLAAFLKDYGWKNVVALFTAMKDKKIPGMLHQIAPRLQHMILTQVNPLTRCASQEQLEKACVAEKISYDFEESSRVAFDKAVSKAEELQLPLIIFGSIYLAGEILPIFTTKTQK